MPLPQTHTPIPTPLPHTPLLHPHPAPPPLDTAAHIHTIPAAHLPNRHIHTINAPPARHTHPRPPLLTHTHESAHTHIHKHLLRPRTPPAFPALQTFEYCIIDSGTDPPPLPSAGSHSPARPRRARIARAKLSQPSSRDRPSGFFKDRGSARAAARQDIGAHPHTQAAARGTRCQSLDPHGLPSRATHMGTNPSRIANAHREGARGVRCQSRPPASGQTGGRSPVELLSTTGPSVNGADCSASLGRLKRLGLMTRKPTKFG